MSAMSNYLETALANLVLRGTSFTSPGDVYLALATSSLGDANTGTEANYVGYARRAMRDSGAGQAVSGQFTAPDANGTVSNGYAITFPAVGGSVQVAITHWGIYDAPSGGNLLFHGAMSVPKTLDPNDVPSFPPNTLQITFN